MKHSTLIRWLSICLLLGMAWPGLARARERTAFHYGARVPRELIAAYDQIVVEPSHLENLDDFAGPARERGGSRRALPVAYLSVGEIAKGTDEAQRVSKSWVLAENTAWASLVMDLGHEGYRKHLLAKFERLWAEGYRRFFLDTLDSYRLAPSGAGEERARKALVAILRGMKRRHPEVRLVLNRGFEILGEVRGLVSGVAAESLFDRWDAAAQRYTRVPRDDRRWLLERLRQVRDRYGIPVTVIDYRPPHQVAEARATARRIHELGFEPWVTNAALTSLGVGSLEILPRRVLILGDEPDADARTGHEPEPLRLLAPVLEYLGYVPEYQRAVDNWAELSLDGGYLRVITWLSDSRPRPGYAEWVRAQRERGVRFVIFGVPGFDLTGEMARELGISLVAPGAAQPTRVLEQDEVIGFEAAPPRRPFDGPIIDVGRQQGTRVHLRLGDASGRSGVAVATTPWGGLALSHVLALRGLQGERAWVVDPFAFLESALDLPQAPMPNVTTASGRRLAMLLVRAQGLGWPAAQPQLDSAAALGQWLAERHPWPHGVSIDPSAGERVDAADRAAAERLLERPFFELSRLRPGSTRAQGAAASLTQVSSMFFGGEVRGPIAFDSGFLSSTGPQAHPYRQVLAALEFTEAPRRLEPVLVDYHGFMASSPGGRATLGAIYDWLETHELHPLHVQKYAELARAFREQVVARDPTGAFHYFAGERLATVRSPLPLGLPLLEASSAACVRRGPDGNYISFAGASERRLELGAEALDHPHVVHANGELLHFEVESCSSDSCRVRLELAAEVPLELALAGLPKRAACELEFHGGRLSSATNPAGELTLALPQPVTGAARLRCHNPEKAP